MLIYSVQHVSFETSSVQRTFAVFKIGFQNFPKVKDSLILEYSAVETLVKQIATKAKDSGTSGYISQICSTVQNLKSPGSPTLTIHLTGLQDPQICSAHIRKSTPESWIRGFQIPCFGQPATPEVPSSLLGELRI